MALTQEELLNTQDTLYNFLIAFNKQMEDMKLPGQKFIETMDALINVLAEQIEGLEEVKGSVENTNLATNIRNLLGSEISALNYMKRLLNDLVTLKANAGMTKALISNEVQPMIKLLKLAA